MKFPENWHTGLSKLAKVVSEKVFFSFFLLLFFFFSFFSFFPSPSRLNILTPGSSVCKRVYVNVGWKSFTGRTSGHRGGCFSQRAGNFQLFRIPNLGRRPIAAFHRPRLQRIRQGAKRPFEKSSDKSTRPFHSFRLEFTEFKPAWSLNLLRKFPREMEYRLGFLNNSWLESFSNARRFRRSFKIIGSSHSTCFSFFRFTKLIVTDFSDR